MDPNTVFQNGSISKLVSSSNINNSRNDNSLENLTSENYAELKAIFTKLSSKNPVSDTLFLEKYQILLLENFLPCQKPLGEIFQISFVICQAKLRKLSEHSDSQSEVFSDDGGAPLPLQFDKLYPLDSTSRRTKSLVEQLSEKYQLLPLTGIIGRKFLALLDKIDMDDLSKKLPTICICHGNNPKTVMLLGSFKKNHSRVIFQTQGLVTKQEQLPRVSSVKETHLSGFNPLFTNIDTSVYAQYDFLKCENVKSSVLNPVNDSSIRIECWWSDVSALLEPLAATCTCIAKIKAVAGNNVTGAFSLYKEIQFLETLQRGLATGVMSWSISNQNSSVIKRIKEFINEQKTLLHKKDKSVPMDFSWEFFDDAVLKTRNNLDFSEKLWNILKDSSSKEELQESFMYVYQSLAEFFRPPFISQKNKSTLARDIKRMMEKPISRSSISSTLAMQLLLEIGVEKMRRDYVTIFMGLNLPLESLSYFLEPDLLSADAITSLKKLHSVLELIIVCVKQLNLSSDLLSEFSRSALKHYSTVPKIDLSHIFSFQIPAVKARQLLNPMRPIVWEVSFVSKMEDFMKQSIHRYVTTPSHEHVYAPEKYHPKLMLKTASYVYSTATLVQSNEFSEVE